jgi:hypothetical protein
MVITEIAISSHKVQLENTPMVSHQVLDYAFQSNANLKRFNIILMILSIIMQYLQDGQILL